MGDWGIAERELPFPFERPLRMAAKDWKADVVGALRDNGLSISGKTAALAEGETNPGIRSEMAVDSVNVPLIARLR